MLSHLSNQPETQAKYVTGKQQEENKIILKLTFFSLASLLTAGVASTLSVAQIFSSILISDSFRLSISSSAEIIRMN